MSDAPIPSPNINNKDNGASLLGLKISKPLSYTVAGLCLCYIVPLSHWWRLAWSSDLYSHTILIPLVSLYFVWENRGSAKPSKPNRILAVAPLAVGLVSLIAFFTTNADPHNTDQIENYLAYSIFSLVCFVISATFFNVGFETVRKNLFPILFLAWVTPFTADLREGIQILLQHASAECAYWLIDNAGVPIFKEDLVFQMPTIVMEVAPECSGLRSTLVLLITSVVASFLFLKTPWKRTVLVLLVIPLGIIRNGIRILILALQCYHIGPEMIDGWFHNHGGQPLFLVTLIPLFLLLYWFWRSESKKRNLPKKASD